MAWLKTAWTKLPVGRKRAAAAFALLAVLAAGTLALLPNQNPPSPTAPGPKTGLMPKTAVLPKRVVTIKPAKIRAVDVAAFRAELAMTPAALIARWDKDIRAASQRFGVPEKWIRAVMRQESGGRTVMAGGIPITSTAGAMGVMQVMPETYADMRAAHHLGADPYNPRDSILAGSAYLRFLRDKYGYPALFAAYNDGPGDWELHVARKRDLPAETIAYVASIATMLGEPIPAIAQKASPTLQLTRPDGVAVSVDAASVRTVRAVLPGEYPASAKTVLILGTQRQAIREDVEQVSTLLQRARGGI